MVVGGDGCVEVVVGPMGERSSDLTTVAYRPSSAPIRTVRLVMTPAALLKKRERRSPRPRGSLSFPDGVTVIDQTDLPDRPAAAVSE